MIYQYKIPSVNNHKYISVYMYLHLYWNNAGKSYFFVKPIEKKLYKIILQISPIKTLLKFNSKPIKNHYYIRFPANSQNI